METIAGRKRGIPNRRYTDDFKQAAVERVIVSGWRIAPPPPAPPWQPLVG